MVNIKIHQQLKTGKHIFLMLDYQWGQSKEKIFFPCETNVKYILL